MTEHELNRMEDFATMIAEQLEDVREKAGEIDRLVEYLGDRPAMEIAENIVQIKEEQSELHYKLSDLNQAVDEFENYIQEMQNENQGA